MGVIAALIYFVLPASLAIAILYFVFRLVFQKISDKEKAEKHQTELRKRLAEEFPDQPGLSTDLHGELTTEEIEISIKELKQERGD